MHMVQNGIANLLRKKTLKKGASLKKSDEPPAERTAQTILNARQVPKKNASKEAKNMLNSIQTSLKKQTSEGL